MKADKQMPVSIVYTRARYLWTSLLLVMIGMTANYEGFTEGAWVLFAAAIFSLGYRKVTRFDPGKGKYNIGYRLYGLPLWLSRFDLSEITAVRIEYKVVTHETDTVTNTTHHYEVSLIRMPPQVVKEVANAHEARLLGEKIAKCIHTQLFDGSLGIVNQRTDKELDMSLGERLRYRGEAVENPEFPSGSRIQPLSLSGEIHLRLPAQPMPGVILVIFTTLIAVVGGLSFYAEMPIQGIIVFCIAMTSMYMLFLYFTTFQSTDLWISSACVRYRKFPYQDMILFSELEEAVYKEGRLRLISDEKTIGLPFGFNKEDGLYVRKLIEYMAYRNHEFKGSAYQP